MFTVTRIFTLVFDALLAPFGEYRMAGLVVVSILCGAALTLLYRATSNGTRIRRTRELFKARILEMRLYPDDLVLITRALFGAIAAQGSYLRAAARPIILVALVAVPVFVQLEARFARRAHAPGSHALVTASLKPDLDPRAVPASLSAADGVRVDARPLRVPATREIVWRVDVGNAGVHAMELRTYDLVYRFDLRADRSTRAIGHRREARSFSDAAFHPGLPAFAPDSPLASVRVSYEDATYGVLGTRVSWLAVFLVGTLAGALIPAWLLRVAL